MNRADLMRALRQAGYEGPPELDAIVKFLTDEGIDLRDGKNKPIDAKGVEAALSAKKSVVIGYADDGKDTVSALKMEPMDEEESEDQPEDEPEKRAKPNKVKAAEASWKGGYTPTQAARRSETKRYMERRGLSRTDKRRAKSDNPDEVREFGAAMRSLLVGKGRPVCDEDRDILEGNRGLKGHVTNDNLLGGATVPQDFYPFLIDLKEDYGVIRQIVGVTPMRNDTLTTPRRTSSVTVYAPGEGNAATESNMGTDNVELVARKMIAYSRISSELLNDSALNFGDVVAGEHAWALAEKEDDCAVNGDGTSTYFGVVGLRSKLRAVDGTIGNIAGITVGTGSASYTALVLADFMSVHGNLPDKAAKGNPQWLASRFFKSTVMDKLGLVPIATGAGGTNKQDVAGAVLQSFLGYPVVVSQQMPRTAAASQLCAFFGDFGQSCMFGEVTGSMKIDMSVHDAFQSDEVSIRSIQRVAFNFHSPGDTSDPGFVVALATGA